jgi:hypothetical protein
MGELAPLEGLGAVELGLVLGCVPAHMKHGGIIDDVGRLFLFAAYNAMANAKALA